MRLPPELRTIAARELCAALERDGFVLDRQRGSHRVYRNPHDGRRAVIVYRRPGDTFPLKTLQAILEDLGWNESDLKRLKLL
jgi:predicted RNA binding protein YcfA (HicA-like mRNA interferase family)